MKKLSVIILSLIIVFTFAVNGNCISMTVAQADTEKDYIAVDAAVAVDAVLMTYAKSVVLMERSTGKVLYAENENEQLYPASVTKIMTILLVCEAIEQGKINKNDVVSCSENAASKGGSQIWLEPGESMTVDELLRATCIYSANDACTLLGEYIAGSEDAFNQMMNERAAELGMNGTHFDNCTGLDDTTETHLTTTYDVALMSRELLKHDFIKEYTTIWMDSLRDGETQLVNTNKLVRYYDGITGLKTGTTEKAGCCVSASAERDGMELIAVVMGSENSNDRFNSARNLLDWGFANYEIFTPSPDLSGSDSISVLFGESDHVGICIPELAPVLINKGSADKISINIDLEQELTAPVAENQVVGKIYVIMDEKVISESDITAENGVGKLTFFTALHKLLSSFSKLT